MSTAATMSPREYIRFDLGKPELIRLKYQTGREVVSQRTKQPQIMFTTTEPDGSERLFYVEPEVAQKIADARIAKGEPFRLIRFKARGAEVWTIETLGQDGLFHEVTAEPELRTPAQPTPTIAPRTASNSQEQQPQQPNPTSISPLTAKLCGSMCAQIDAMREAKVYAQRCGIDLTNEDLRCLVNTAFIQASREGGR